MIDKYGNEYVEFFVTSDNDSSLYIIYENGVSKDIMNETLNKYHEGEFESRLSSKCSLVAAGDHNDFKKFLDFRKNGLR